MHKFNIIFLFNTQFCSTCLKPYKWLDFFEWMGILGWNSFCIWWHIECKGHDYTFDYIQIERQQENNSKKQFHNFGRSNICWWNSLFKTVRGNYKWALLMSALRAYINKPFYETFYEKMKKLPIFLTVFSILYKMFSKIDD